MTGQPFNLESLVELARRIREEQAANPERTRLEQLILGKFAYSLESVEAARMLATAILADGFHRLEAHPGEGIWTMTDSEFNRARKEERIAELRDAANDLASANSSVSAMPRKKLIILWLRGRANRLEAEL